jgi:hypothetical protein
MGALVGAGYGVIEAQWLMNAIFAAGFSLGMVSTYGLIVLAGFWERFFTIAFHTASGAVLGWGIAGRKWWLFYLIATAWHILLNYSVILYQVGAVSSLQVELAIAVMADFLFVYAFLLRWRNTPETELTKLITPSEITLPEEIETATSETPAKVDATKPSEAPQETSLPELPGAIADGGQKPAPSNDGGAQPPPGTEHDNPDGHR